MWVPETMTWEPGGGHSSLIKHSSQAQKQRVRLSCDQASRSTTLARILSTENLRGRQLAKPKLGNYRKDDPVSASNRRRDNNSRRREGRTHSSKPWSTATSRLCIWARQPHEDEQEISASLLEPGPALGHCSQWKSEPADGRCLTPSPFLLNKPIFKIHQSQKIKKEGNATQWHVLGPGSNNHFLAVWP